MTDRTLNPTAPMHTLAQDEPSATPAVLHPTQTFYWSVRREIWEHRSIYLAPLAVAGLLILGTGIAAFGPLRSNISLADLDIDRQRQLLAAPFDIAALALMGASFLVAFFYCLDALYGERRDRSILFWKSLPVSDTTAVLSKATIPVFVIPLVCFAITIVTQAVMSVLVVAGLSAHGVHPAFPISQLPLVRMSALLFFHLVVIHGLWFAPIYAWLILVSSYARRAPFLWAVLPPLGVMLVEKLAFGTAYFAAILENQFSGGGTGASFSLKYASTHGMSEVNAGTAFASPGLWLGLVVAAALLAGAVQMRRSRGPL
jgi:ABC-2 type transport system permease protein